MTDTETELSPEFIDVHRKYTNEQLMMKLKLVIDYYGKAVDKIETLQQSKIIDINMIDDLVSELSVVSDIADNQDEVLQIVAEFLDEWALKDCAPGSRDRSVQIAIEQLTNRLDTTEAVQTLKALIEEPEETKTSSSTTDEADAGGKS